VAGSPPRAARNALRQTLFVLRKALGRTEDVTLLVTGDAITLPSQAVQTDVVAFEHAVAEATPAALETATLIALSWIVALGPGGHAAAQVAGSTRLGVAVEELRTVALGWSAKKQILGQPVYN
jgi:hypothetical protein